MSMSPSNKLYSGKVQDLQSALACMVQQYRQEIQWINAKYRRIDPDDATDGVAELLALITTVQQCQSEYRQAVQAAEQTLFQRWAANDDEERKRIGEAGLSGDYSILAL